MRSSTTEHCSKKRCRGPFPKKGSAFRHIERSDEAELTAIWKGKERDVAITDHGDNLGANEWQETTDRRSAGAGNERNESTWHEEIETQRKSTTLRTWRRKNNLGVLVIASVYHCPTAV